MEKDNLRDKEYNKSRFRCPICGSLAGCSPDGKIGMFGLKTLHRHVRNCRSHFRVKPEKDDTRE